ncbi:MAG: ArsA-related P-loop ATPase, partial [Candidatus Hodarchaeota archaeon]
RVVKELVDYGIPVNHLIVNNVLPEGDAIYESSFLQARQAVQRPYLEKLEQLFGEKTIRVPMLPIEVKGLKALREISQYLEGTTGTGSRCL